MNTTDTRAAFEAWAESEGRTISQWPSGEYEDSLLNSQWDAVQAVAATEAAPAQDLSAAILALPLPETNYNAYSDGSEPLWNKEHIAHILNEAAKIASGSSRQPLPTMVTSDMMNAGADAMREGLPMLNRGRSYQSVCKKVFEAMLALASPADALVAGDRVDAGEQIKEILSNLQRWELDCGDMMEHTTGHWVSYWDIHPIIWAPEGEAVAAILQSKNK